MHDDGPEVPEEGQGADGNAGGDLGAHHFAACVGAGEAQRQRRGRVGLFACKRFARGGVSR